MRMSASPAARPEEPAYARRIEQTVRTETAEFVRRIGTLSDDPDARQEVLKQTVRQVAGRLLEEFGDHYALAGQFRILSELAWLGPDALKAVSTGAASHSSETGHRSKVQVISARIPAPDDSCECAGRITTAA